MFEIKKLKDNAHYFSSIKVRWFDGKGIDQIYFLFNSQPKLGAY
jgi:hypothetical protein